jgi:hypothetical protein
MFSQCAKQLELSENTPIRRGLSQRSPSSRGARHGGPPSNARACRFDSTTYGTPIAKLAESQASEHTLMTIAGHVSRKMIEHYSHIRMEAKRALSTLANVQSSQAVLEAGVNQNVNQVPTGDSRASTKSLN